MLTVVEIAKKHQSGNYFEAAQGYKTLLLQKPEDAEILNLYGLCLSSLGDFDQAIFEFCLII